MNRTQPTPARVPLSRLAERPPSPAVARILVRAVVGKAGGFNSAI
ncbi:hypothetical protein [Streptomyces caniscabiei]|nr:hypothetical protein [Streptomyces caniscabiei]